MAKITITKYNEVKKDFKEPVPVLKNNNSRLVDIVNNMSEEDYLHIMGEIEKCRDLLLFQDFSEKADTITAFWFYLKNIRN